MNADEQALITEAVERAEQKTQAEFVVLVANASSDYFEADLLLGAISGFLFLVAAIYLPNVVALDYLPVETLIGFTLGTFLGRRLAWLRYQIISNIRLSKAISRRARAMFVTYRVSNTQQRIGVLIYASLFEKSANIVPDLAVQEYLEAAELRQLEQTYQASLRNKRQITVLIELIENLSAILAERLPSHGQSHNYLPNSPQDIVEDC